MNGELAYKDIHGRIWHIKHIKRSEDGRFIGVRIAPHYWAANTLDIGHTRNYGKWDYYMEDLLASIDREEFTTDDRSARPLESGAEGVRFAETSRETGAERIEEISRHANEADGHDSEGVDSFGRFEERGE